MERQIRQAQREDHRQRRQRHCNERGCGERQADGGADAEEHAADVGEIARPDETQRADRQPGCDRRDDERKRIDHLRVVVPAHAGTQ
jgi:hypothetical protein